MGGREQVIIVQFDSYICKAIYIDASRYVTVGGILTQVVSTECWDWIGLWGHT